jgi:16S rRNA processing protein RimM
MTSPYPRVQDFFLLGKVLKSHGTAGQLRVMIEDKYKSYMVPGAFLFFDINGSKVPHRIMEVEDHAHFVVVLEDIGNKNVSDTLSGKEFWITWITTDKMQPRHLKSPKSIADRWELYTLVDQRTDQSFPVLRTEEFPQQLMAVIEHRGKELYIPLNDQLIQSIDRGQKIIVMEIPEGLLDL